MTNQIRRARLVQLLAAAFSITISAAIVGNIGAQQKTAVVSARGNFEITEATIAEAHAAMRAGKLTSHQLVDGYLQRIRASDQPSRLNAIVLINPNALAEADKLDQEFKRTGKMRPLQGIPVIVKDNYDTFDLQTTGGSLAMKGNVPPTDAFMVKKLRDAGAIVLAKSNMAEWAFSPYVTVSSIAGITRNPYDLERVPAGSSGGTCRSGRREFRNGRPRTDTENSLRGPYTAPYLGEFARRLD